MPRRMSCALTKPQVLDRSKGETRRHHERWANLRPGDRLTLIEKGMGLRKGERQVVLAEVEVTDVRVERLSAITPEGVEAEGFPGHTPEWFVTFWRNTHGVRADAPDPWVRVIRWRYLDPEEV